ncbi:hypothetical protein INR49_005876, partial [Caranx melampygus]
GSRSTLRIPETHVRLQTPTSGGPASPVPPAPLPPPPEQNLHQVTEQSTSKGGSSTSFLETPHPPLLPPKSASHPSHPPSLTLTPPGTGPCHVSLTDPSQPANDKCASEESQSGALMDSSANTDTCQEINSSAAGEGVRGTGDEDSWLALVDVRQEGMYRPVWMVEAFGVAQWPEKEEEEQPMFGEKYDCRGKSSVMSAHPGVGSDAGRRRLSLSDCLAAAIGTQ